VRSWSTACYTPRSAEACTKGVECRMYNLVLGLKRKSDTKLGKTNGIHDHNKNVVAGRV